MRQGIGEASLQTSWTRDASPRRTLPRAQLGIVLSPRTPDRLEPKPPIAQDGHDEPAPFIGGVRLIVTPAAKGNELIEVEVRPALRALHHVVDVQAAADATGLTAPVGPRQDLLADRGPFWPTGRSATLSPGACRTRAAARSEADRRPPPQHAAAQRFCPRGQKARTPSN